MTAEPLVVKCLLCGHTKSKHEGVINYYEDDTLSTVTKGLCTAFNEEDEHCTCLVFLAHPFDVPCKWCGYIHDGLQSHTTHP